MKLLIDKKSFLLLMICILYFLNFEISTKNMKQQLISWSTTITNKIKLQK
jgi:hypothetical protein